MNRSILIVICDFLLVSLLVFSTADVNKVGDAGAHGPQDGSHADQPGRTARKTSPPPCAWRWMRSARTRPGCWPNSPRPAKPPANGMSKTRKLQHNSRRASRRSRAPAAAANQSRTASRRRTDQHSRPGPAVANHLEPKPCSRKRNWPPWRPKTGSRPTRLRRLQRQLAELARSNQMILAEKQRLSAKLDVAEVEKRAAAEQAARMTDEVKAERTEKARLARQREDTGQQLRPTGPGNPRQPRPGAQHPLHRVRHEPCRCRI